MEIDYKESLEKIINSINLADFYFDLSPEKIAQKPLENRQQSKLLLANCSNQSIEHHHFFDIPKLIPKPALLFINETKVISARLHFNKKNGGKVEIFCLEPKMDVLVTSLNNFFYDLSSNNEIQNISNEINQQDSPKANLLKSTVWNCLIGGKRVRENDEFTANFAINGEDIALNAKILEKDRAEAVVKFSWNKEYFNFNEILGAYGKVPLPPYIKRSADEEDATRYQTVYAKKFGSVASPTAGLHFTEDILNNLSQNDIKIAKLNLNIGLGTFKPIQSDNIFDHSMHKESFSISLSAVEELLDAKKNGKRIIATGTTSLRVLESLPVISAKINKGIDLAVAQWDSYLYEKENLITSTEKALEIIIDFLKIHNLSRISTDTSLFIIPGFKFRIVDTLITNYHLPKTTLVLLVAAFLGKDFWKKVYSEALENDYRFLSYGDSSLLIREML